MSSDPLSFFAGDDSSTSESESGEDAAPERETKDNTEDQENGNKLPSPSTLFASIGRPDFLDNPLEKHIDWDRFVKNPDSPPESNVHASGHYAAIPPPKTEAFPTSTPSEISAPPIKYSTPSDQPDASQLSVSNTLSSDSDISRPAGTKRAHPVADNTESSSKKQKGETFREKEKRKRDLGQTSRGKSYVEEEKRILRQHFGKDEQ